MSVYRVGSKTRTSSVWEPACFVPILVFVGASEKAAYAERARRIPAQSQKYAHFFQRRDIRCLTLATLGPAWTVDASSVLERGQETLA